MDAVRELERRLAEDVEVKCLAGRIVWLRRGEREWLGPAEEALVLLGDGDLPAVLRPPAGAPA